MKDLKLFSTLKSIIASARLLPERKAWRKDHRFVSIQLFVYLQWAIPHYHSVTINNPLLCENILLCLFSDFLESIFKFECFFEIGIYE